MSFTLLALVGCQSIPKVAQETPSQAFSAETESGEAQERLNQINFLISNPWHRTLSIQLANISFFYTPIGQTSLHFTQY